MSDFDRRFATIRTMVRGMNVFHGPAMTIVFVPLVLGIAQQGHASDICVMCYDPPAVYRCQTAAGVNATPQVHIACLQQIADGGAHGSCSIRRGLAGSDCIGPLRTVIVPGPAETVTGAPSSGDAKAISRGGSANSDGTPGIVAESARRAKGTEEAHLKAGDEQIREAGKKSSGALKRGWDCIVSLFKDCGAQN